ncbi:rapid alkalinization factor-like [Bidens hawaiensis]|uniref:rapid alkalinization factor-like n=1 Tax=Bidens hawaiensis TaxID=980011 RepID=UPI00404B88D6
MPTSLTNLLLLLVISAVFLPPAAAGIADFNWLPSQGGECSGSIAECMADGAGELEMESESTRRILATTRYISYGALQGNNVPCSQRGASYYNCRSGGQANPYQRGCSTITRCRR